MKSKIALVLLSLTTLTATAFAEEVTRTEATGKARIMVVGNCSPLPTQDLNGQIRIGYQLPVTKCVEYRTYKALKTGKSWNAKYEKIGPETLSYNMKMETQDFANYYSTNDVYDTLMVNMSLMAQCNGIANQLESVKDARACQ